MKFYDEEVIGEIKERSYIIGYKEWQAKKNKFHQEYIWKDLLTPKCIVNVKELEKLKEENRKYKKSIIEIYRYLFKALPGPYCEQIENILKHNRVELMGDKL